MDGQPKDVMFPTLKPCILDVGADELISLYSWRTNHSAKRCGGEPQGPDHRCKTGRYYHIT